MPVYEYICDKCEHVTEALRPMADADAAQPCEKCGSDKTHRAQSVFAASSGASGKGETFAGPGCGRCGDPRGACGM